MRKIGDALDFHSTQLAPQPLPQTPIPWDAIRNFIVSLGVVKGTFVVFFWVMHWAVFSLYRGRLKDREKEIERLARENKEHRERFTALIDKQLHIPRSLIGAGGGKKPRRK